MNSREQVRAELLEILKDPIFENPEDAYISAGNALFIASSRLGKPRPATHLSRWSKLNEILGGFPPNQFSILSGRSGVGKTTLLSSWSLDLISQGIPHYIASIELGFEEYVANLASGILGRSFWSISESEKEKAKLAAQSILDTEFTVFSTYDSRVSHINMLTDILHAHRTLGTKVAFVDNINFIMEPKRGADQNLEMDRAIHDFVTFCKKVPIHIVMVMHPRKNDDKDGRIRGMFDIKGSSTAVQEAANVMLLNLLENEGDAPIDVDAKNCREILFDKVRFNGRETGSKIILTLENNGHLMREARYVK